jgi:prevent-host-death family protein
MIKANVAEVKAHFSSYVRKAKAGEVVVVCERNVPVAELRPLSHEEAPTKRELGTMNGLIVHMEEDAFAPMSEEELADWYDAPLSANGDA